MTALWLLLRRALFPGKGNILAFALWVSTVGVGLGIMLVLLVLAVMTGFQTMLEENFTRISSRLVVIPPSEEPLTPGFREKLLKIEGIAAATPFQFGQAMVMKPGAGGMLRGGVTLEGVDLETTNTVTPWESIWVEKPLSISGNRWIWIGVQLAKKLDIKAGDTVNLMLAGEKQRRVLPFTVTALTKFGIYEHDLRYAMVDLKELGSLFGYSGFEPKYKTRLKPDADPTEVEYSVISEMGDFITVKHWYEINQNLMMAVKHQKGTLFLMLQIIVALAAVNVTNLLLMTTNHRKRDVAILRAMGLRFRAVFVYFVTQGTLVGGMGVLLGIVLGLLVCKLTEWLQLSILEEQIYNVSKLPLEVRLSDLGWISICALLVCVLFSVVPALKAARSKPIEVLRQD